MEKDSSTNELFYYDIIKIVLSVIVVIRHCCQSIFLSKGIYVRMFNVIISPIAVPIFFAISGFLFFRKKRNIRVFIYRILKLYIVWTIIYLPLTVWVYYNSNLKNQYVIIDFMKKMLFDGTYYHLWYLPSLCFAIFIVFLLDKIINNNGMLLLGTILYTIGVLVETYSIMFPEFFWKTYREIFFTTRNGLFFGMIFVIIGKYVSEVKPRNNFLFLFIGLITTLLEGVYLITGQNKSLVNMSFSSLILVFAIICLINNITTIRSDGKIYRNMSTIIFCIHPWYIVLVKKIIDNPFLSTISVLAAAIITSYIIISLSRRIKFFKILY